MILASYSSELILGGSLAVAYWGALCVAVVMRRMDRS